MYILFMYVYIYNIPRTHGRPLFEGVNPPIHKAHDVLINTFGAPFGFERYVYVTKY